MIDWFSFLKIKERANKRARTCTDGFSQRLVLWLASLARHRFSYPSLLLEGNLDEDAANHGATVREAAIGTHTYEQYRGGDAGGEKPTQARWANMQTNKQKNLAAAKEFFFLLDHENTSSPSLLLLPPVRSRSPQPLCCAAGES